MKLVQDQGQKQDVRDPDGVVEAEPYFAPVKHKIAGAIYGVTDSSGDSVKFCRQVQAACERMGSKFVLGNGVTRLSARGGKVQSVTLDDGGSLTADLFVLSAGVHSPKIARSVGVRLPIAPAKGYSATFPIKGNGGKKLRIGYVDEEMMVASRRDDARHVVSDRRQLT